jgi:predicted HicB family RNase H-like nuclease
MRDKKPKVGRPSLGKDARSVVLQSRVQETEKKEYQKVAKANGKDLSTWIRETLNAAIKA